MPGQYAGSVLGLAAVPCGLGRRGRVGPVALEWPCGPGVRLVNF